ncbi:hypothetical protein DPMN_178763 [Dreissena polymorpha]|uniref:Uncharacterized protein n=1 Tax=Dreissena polymorpha TaxID=45954 RepID=A0A9D4ECU3_DREPO|nr:hypothetical protein DPMN_178763 [Dreissena polymorpha]
MIKKADSVVHDWSVGTASLIWIDALRKCIKLRFPRTRLIYQCISPELLVSPVVDTLLVLETRSPGAIDESPVVTYIYSVPGVLRLIQLRERLFRVKLGVLHIALELLHRDRH